VLLITRNGNDFTDHFPFIAMALKSLPVRSCIIDGEAIVCDENGLAVFELIRLAKLLDDRDSDLSIVLNEYYEKDGEMPKFPHGSMAMTDATSGPGRSSPCLPSLSSVRLFHWRTFGLFLLKKPAWR
jgi:hypothetical protein